MDKRAAVRETIIVSRTGMLREFVINHFRHVRLDLSAESAAIQQCFSLTTNQRTVLSAQ
jgi:hypothetical protein